MPRSHLNSERLRDRHVGPLNRLAPAASGPTVSQFIPFAAFIHPTPTKRLCKFSQGVSAETGVVMAPPVGG